MCCAINGKYGDIITWEGAASFETAKPGNGVKIGTDTVITVKVAGEVTLINGYELPTTDYQITYKDGKATIKFVRATGTYGTCLGGIRIDTSVTPEDSIMYDVTFKFEDGTTEDKVEKVVAGEKIMKPADPIRDGWTFKYWYTGADDSVEYDFNTAVTGALELKAKWQEGAEATEYVAGDVIDMSTITQIYQAGTDRTTGMELGVLLDATADGAKIQENGDNAIFNSGATIKVKVAEGLTVLPVWHNATPVGSYSVSERDADGYVTIAANAGAGTYIMKIMVIHAYNPEAGGTIDIDEMNATVQNHYADNGILVIDAKASGAKLVPNNGYAQVNGGTVLKVKAPEGDTTGTRLQSYEILAYNNADITDRYTPGFADGYYTLTAISNDQPGCYPKSISILIAPAAEGGEEA